MQKAFENYRVNYVGHSQDPFLKMFKKEKTFLNVLFIEVTKILVWYELNVQEPKQKNLNLIFKLYIIKLINFSFF